MPHLVLEYSNNLDLAEDFNSLFQQLHQLLAEKLPTDLANCKSRCIPHALFFIGDQNENNAFLHLTLKILPGRSDSLKRQLGEELLKCLSLFLKEKKTNLKINLSVEILDSDRHYFKNRC